MIAQQLLGANILKPKRKDLIGKCPPWNGEERGEKAKMQWQVQIKQFIKRTLNHEETAL